MATEQEKALLVKEDLFKKFLHRALIYIVDTSPASRTRLIKILIELGGKLHQIQNFANYEETEAQIGKEIPDMILSDYMLNNGKSGFDLLQAFRNNAETKKSLIVLITSNSSQSLVAQAAEEDVDSFILKPYSAQTLKNTLMTSALDKFHPNPYVKAVEEGKVLLYSGKPEESLVIFKKAMTLHPKPALACFYYGQAEFMLKSLAGAEKKYQEGLAHNKIHYKCLTNLFDLLHQNKRYDEAYDVVKQIAEFFPANPNRLATVLRLAIMTENYVDIEDYYNIFLSIEIRNDLMIKYICAALITTGRYFLINKNTEKAYKLFEKAKVSSAGHEKFLLYSIQNLIEFHKDEQTPSYLERFTRDQHESNEYKVAEFIALDHKRGSTESIKLGQELIKLKILHYCIHYIVIKRLVEAKQIAEAQLLYTDALLTWQDKARYFEELSQYFEKPVE
ncbi:MAG: response regulator [Pseudomonadota bacterium]